MSHKLEQSCYFFNCTLGYKSDQGPRKMYKELVIQTPLVFTQLLLQTI